MRRLETDQPGPFQVVQQTLYLVGGLFCQPGKIVERPLAIDQEKDMAMHTREPQLPYTQQGLVAINQARGR